MNILLFGPPGVGKGTQGSRLAREKGIRHFAMGDILRAAVRAGTPAGKRAAAFMQAGKLVPDEVVVGMVEERILEDKSKGFILDGFPRNVTQAKALDAMLARNRLKLDKIIFMDAPEETLFARLGGRLVCKACGFGFHRHYSPPREAGRCDRCGGELYQREDDTDEVISRRLQVYREQTEPLIDYYRSRPGFVRLDADGDMQTVYGRLKAAVEG